VVLGADEADLRRRVQRLGQRIGSDPESLLSDPPSGWIVGTVDVAAERLQALAEAGVHRVMCQHLLHDDLDAVALIGERLAPIVA
jgi:alkanesulfonate monooxygenase SsuD/methylene tetrahydromethanopterin reductase-like flavin-dependent oxidoreductase (luciferase family)